MGRLKGSKNKKSNTKKIIAAINFKTLEFIGIYNNPNHAAVVLFDQSAYNTRIRMCADNETLKVKDITFVWVNYENGFTTETIKEVIEIAKQRKLSQSRALTFTCKMMNIMEKEEVIFLNQLYNKYK
jgi:hypothetical protein